MGGAGAPTAPPGYAPYEVTFDIDNVNTDFEMSEVDLISYGRRHFFLH